MQALNSRSRAAFASRAQPAAGARRSVCVCVKPTKAADFAALNNEEILEKISTLKKARGLGRHLWRSMLAGPQTPMAAVPMHGVGCGDTP